MSAHVRRIFNDPTMGFDATYHPTDGMSADVRVILDLQAQVIVDSMIEVHDQICLMCEQVPVPIPGDVVEVVELDPFRQTRWQLVNRLFDDGFETRWSVRRCEQ